MSQPHAESPIQRLQRLQEEAKAKIAKLNAELDGLVAETFVFTQTPNTHSTMPARFDIDTGDTVADVAEWIQSYLDINPHLTLSSFTFAVDHEDYTSYVELRQPHVPTQSEYNELEANARREFNNAEERRLKRRRREIQTELKKANATLVDAQVNEQRILASAAKPVDQLREQALNKLLPEERAALGL